MAKDKSQEIKDEVEAVAADAPTAEAEAASPPTADRRPAAGGNPPTGLIELTNRFTGEQVMVDPDHYRDQRVRWNAGGFHADGE